MKAIILKPTELLKSRYTRRTGGPGNYRYEYGEKKGRRSAKSTAGVMRPKDKKQIKTFAEQIAERTFDNNESTVQPHDNEELMTAIASYKKEYGEEAEGILLQEYARRYNKLNGLLRSEGDSFKRNRKKNKGKE
jgi:hypothetical protein